MSEATQIQVASPEGAGLIAAVALVYLVVRLLPRWIAAGSERVSSAELERRLAGPSPPLVLDVRTAAEARQTGVVPGACNIPLPRLAGWLQARPDDLAPGRAVVTLCRTEARAAIAARMLRRAGVTSTGFLSGGMDGWTEAGLPTDPVPPGPAAG